MVDITVSTTTPQVMQLFFSTKSVPCAELRGETLPLSSGHSSSRDGPTREARRVRGPRGQTLSTYKELALNVSWRLT